MSGEIQHLLETINPPGLTKPNRSAVFSILDEVFQRVKDDADLAFKAFFPYLADEKKLEQHGKALLVPHLLHDSGDEYRNRVATASFFLTRAGERSYVINQLKEHFGNRYFLTEQFLQIYVKILDLSDEDRLWILEFLDSTLDPNISLTVAEWFHFIDAVDMSDSFDAAAHRTDTDIQQRGWRYDGRLLCDQGIETLCDGRFFCDGSWVCDRFIPARGTVFDTVMVSVFPNGSSRCDGSFDCSGYIRINDPVDIPDVVLPVDTYADKLSMRLSMEPMTDHAVVRAICDGSWVCDGSNLASMLDAPMKLRIIKPLRCDGTKMPSCSLCDGSIICDGSYIGYDGWYYSGDIIEEEVI
jgi:hypothetical protein